MMPKFAEVRWKCHLTYKKKSFAFGVEYFSTIHTGLALWDTLELRFWRCCLRVNRYRMFH